MALLRSVLLAWGTFFIASSASAADYSLPKAAEWDWGAAFAGVDVASHGWAYGWGGAAFSPYGKMDNSGFRLFVTGEGGQYEYPSTSVGTGVPTTIRGTEVGGSLLAGYAIIRSNLELNMYAGLNVQSQQLSQTDPNNPVQGTRAGLELLDEITYYPTAATMLYSWASYSTAFQTYYATFKGGYDIANGHQVFFGPQVTFLGNERFDQFRAGLHLTQLTVGKVGIELSGGYVHDSDNGGGVYGMVEINFPLPVR